MAAPTQDRNSLVLQGVVRYILKIDEKGAEILDAKWVSSRITHFDEPGTGHATRKDSNTAKTGSFEGAWVIKYYEPDGNLAVTAFDLALERKGQVRSRSMKIWLNVCPWLT
jgi:hypothetical protein